MILRWVSRHLVAVALSVAVAAVGTSTVAVHRWVTGREDAAVERDRLARQIADLRIEIAARAEAAAVQRAHAERLAREVEARTDRLRQLQSVEGLDAPLPDPLARAAGVLWPQ